MMQYTVPAPTDGLVTLPVGTLLAALATIPDPRRTHGTRYSLASILALVITAILTNHTAVLAMTQWIAHQPTAFRRTLGFTRMTTPHQTTVQRVLQQVAPIAVVAALRRVLDPQEPGVVRARGSQGVALDGKAQRGRHHDPDVASSVDVVTALCHGVGGLLGQTVVQAPVEAEQTVVPAVIAQVDWTGRVLTGDAASCQTTICIQVVAAGGDYLVRVKANQPTLFADIQQVFTPLTAEEQARSGIHTVHPLPMHTARTVVKAHGRIEERTIRVTSELAAYSRWPHLAQVCEITRTWTCRGKTRTAVRYAVTSLPASVCGPAAVLALFRGHWQIENGLHYVKDVTLGEDRCQTRVGAGADVFALLRTVVVSILRQAGCATIAACLRYCTSHPTAARTLLGIALPENA